MIAYEEEFPVKSFTLVELSLVVGQLGTGGLVTFPAFCKKVE